MTDTYLCPECHEPVVFSDADQARIIAAVRSDAIRGAKQTSGFVTGKCGHVWQWQGGMVGNQSAYKITPYYDTLAAEKATSYRDDMTREGAISAQSSPDGPGRRAFLGVLDQYKGQFASVLEIGCSIGTVTRLVKERYNVMAVGIDFSGPAIKEAWARGNSDIWYFCMDAENVGGRFGPETFDLIYTCGVLMHTGPNLYRQICEQIWALKPKLIVHQEVQGEEMIVERRTDAVYFMRRHDYVGVYEGLGAKCVRHIDDQGVPARALRCGGERGWQALDGTKPLRREECDVWHPLTCVVVEVQ